MLISIKISPYEHVLFFAISFFIYLSASSPLLAVSHKLLTFVSPAAFRIILAEILLNYSSSTMRILFIFTSLIKCSSLNSPISDYYMFLFTSDCSDTLLSLFDGMDKVKSPISFLTLPPSVKLVLFIATIYIMADSRYFNICPLYLEFCGFHEKLRSPLSNCSRSFILVSIIWFYLFFWFIFKRKVTSVPWLNSDSMVICP